MEGAHNLLVALVNESFKGQPQQANLLTSLIKVVSTPGNPEKNSVKYRM